MVEITEEAVGAVCVVHVAGDVDVEAADELRDRLLSCLTRFETVEVDMGGVTFIDSSGLGALVRLRTEAATRGRRTALRNLSPATDRLLQISGLRGLFTVVADG